MADRRAHREPRDAAPQRARSLPHRVRALTGRPRPPGRARAPVAGRRLGRLVSQRPPARGPPIREHRRARPGRGSRAAVARGATLLPSRAEARRPLRQDAGRRRMRLGRGARIRRRCGGRCRRRLGRSVERESVGAAGLVDREQAPACSTVSAVTAPPGTDVHKGWHDPPALRQVRSYACTPVLCPTNSTPPETCGSLNESSPLRVTSGRQSAPPVPHARGNTFTVAIPLPTTRPPGKTDIEVTWSLMNDDDGWILAMGPFVDPIHLGEQVFPQLVGNAST